jgi:hypothetical protein
MAGLTGRTLSAQDRTEINQVEFVTTEELARLLRRDPSTLRRWRTADPVQGPPFLRLSSGATVYDMDDVRRWLASCRIEPQAA